MGNTESSTKEYSSLVSYGKGYEIHREIPLNFRDLNLEFHNCNDFFNSSVTKWNENRNYLRNTSLIEALTDKKYIKFLNKVELDFNFVQNSDVQLYLIKEKFSQIYNELVYFNFDSMSVEYTYDNSFVFSIKDNGFKYLMEYYLDYKIDDYDDVEVIFTKLTDKENYFHEMRLEDVHEFLERELKKENVSKSFV